VICELEDTFSFIRYVLLKSKNLLTTKLFNILNKKLKSSYLKYFFVTYFYFDFKKINIKYYKVRINTMEAYVMGFTSRTASRLDIS
jgi:hypothetical protein